MIDNNHRLMIIFSLSKMRFDIIIIIINNDNNDDDYRLSTNNKPIRMCHTFIPFFCSFMSESGKIQWLQQRRRRRRRQVHWPQPTIHPSIHLYLVDCCHHTIAVFVIIFCLLKFIRAIFFLLLLPHFFSFTLIVEAGQSY